MIEVKFELSPSGEAGGKFSFYWKLNRVPAEGERVTFPSGFLLSVLKISADGSDTDVSELNFQIFATCTATKVERVETRLPFGITMGSETVISLKTLLS